jgi:hypothetical protein
VARTSPEVLAGQFNTEVNIMHEVAFNQNSSSAIDVDAVGIRSPYAGLPLAVML